eukprot:12950154-Alexandrium_andersonii.AAC.1
MDACVDVSSSPLEFTADLKSARVITNRVRLLAVQLEKEMPSPDGVAEQCPAGCVKTHLHVLLLACRLQQLAKPPPLGRLLGAPLTTRGVRSCSCSCSWVACSVDACVGVVVCSACLVSA